MFCDCQDIYQILKLIDLNAYSFSKNFLGYSNYEDSFSVENFERVCRKFQKSFLADYKKSLVISSLFISNNKSEIAKDYEVSIPYIDDFLNVLMPKKIIKMIDFDKLSNGISYDSEAYSKKLEQIENSFSCYYPENSDDLYKIFLSFFKCVGVFGHIFLVLKDFNLIVYPHTDDLGFGFIGMNEPENAQQKDLLKSIFSEDKFKFFCN